MIASKRYFSKNWLLGQLIHSFCAYFITLVIIIWCFKDFAAAGWKINSANPKNVFSVIVLVLVICVTLSGMTSAIIGRFFHTKPWLHHKELQNKIGKIHKFAGLGTIIIGFLTASIAAIEHANNLGRKKNKNLTIFNIVFFIVFSIGIEIYFRIWRKA